MSVWPNLKAWQTNLWNNDGTIYIVLNTFFQPISVLIAFLISILTSYWIIFNAFFDLLQCTGPYAIKNRKCITHFILIGYLFCFYYEFFCGVQTTVFFWHYSKVYSEFLTGIIMLRIDYEYSLLVIITLKSKSVNDIYIIKKLTEIRFPRISFNSLLFYKNWWFIWVKLNWHIILIHKRYDKSIMGTVTLKFVFA